MRGELNRYSVKMKMRMRQRGDGRLFVRREAQNLLAASENRGRGCSNNIVEYGILRMISVMNGEISSVFFFSFLFSSFFGMDCVLCFGKTPSQIERGISYDTKVAALRLKKLIYTYHSYVVGYTLCWLVWLLLFRFSFAVEDSDGCFLFVCFFLITVNKYYFFFFFFPPTPPSCSF